MLEIDGIALTESLVVVEYLAERAGANHPFNPPNARARALARLMVETSPFSNFLVFAKTAGDDAARDTALQRFQAQVSNAERFLGLHGADSGPFLFGQEMSLAEAAIAPFVARTVPCLKEYARVDPFDGIFGYRVARLVDAILARPSVQETSLSEDALFALVAEKVRP